ncbi:glycosyl transferase, group 1 [Halorhodospira halophila SL1]|uniref:Glycosyl transferase, group 1 n=1 Tax=Halorhodospira halophila (strain DSM 244 / SL1) TaxID=349124 RepID=A1WV44_HALHL|nr:glycosyl transferase, group 1 [Halorhodospira halophila SL1]MBK1728803.1 glycosyltransferase [Halorhodospira halophila]
MTPLGLISVTTYFSRTREHQLASTMKSESQIPPIAFFVPSVIGGGAQRVFVTLANTLVDMTAHPIHLVVIRDGGEFWSEVRPEVEIVNLGASRMRYALPALTRYLQTVRPQALCSTLTYCNVVTILAWRLAGRPCRLLVREANVVRKEESVRRALMRLTYPQADHVIALSPELHSNILDANVPVRDSIATIGNPALDFQAIERTTAALDFLPRPNPRFICAVGSLTYQKGFDTLLTAFARLSDTSVHLVILGEGELRPSLEAQSEKLGIAHRVHLVGFVARPTDIVQHASLFVLSSRWEGFPNVLLEALGTGVPVVATDCPGANRSILRDGELGHLADPDDPDALAHSIAEALTDPRATPTERQERAQEFAAPKIAREYLDLFGAASKTAPER